MRINNFNHLLLAIVIYFYRLKIEVVDAFDFTDIIHPFPKIIFPLNVMNNKVTMYFCL